MLAAAPTRTVHADVCIEALESVLARRTSSTIGARFAKPRRIVGLIVRDGG